MHQSSAAITTKQYRHFLAVLFVCSQMLIGLQVAVKPPSDRARIDDEELEAWLQVMNLRAFEQLRTGDQVEPPSVHSWIVNGKHSFPRLAEDLRQRLVAPISRDVLPQLILALGLVGDSTDSKAVRQYLHTGDVYVRSQALTALARLGTGEVLQDIIGAALCDPHENVRATACTSMLIIRDPSDWRYDQVDKTIQVTQRTHWKRLAVHACDSVIEHDESAFVRDVATQTRRSLLAAGGEPDPV